MGLRQCFLVFDFSTAQNGHFDLVVTDVKSQEGRQHVGSKVEAVLGGVSAEIKTKAKQTETTLIF